MGYEKGRRGALADYGGASFRKKNTKPGGKEVGRKRKRVTKCTNEGTRIHLTQLGGEADWGKGREQGYTCRRGGDYLVWHSPQSAAGGEQQVKKN